MKPVMRVRRRAERAVILTILALAVSALFLAAPDALAEEPVSCGTWAELSAALRDSSTTGIVLTNDITIPAGGCQINVNMADGLVIDGKDPVTGENHTLTDCNTLTQADTLRVDGNGTLKNITLQNLTITGKNYYGAVTVYDAARGVNLTYKNVEYTGPQMNYNLYGSVTYSDCDIEITGNNAQECAEAAKVILDGTTTIRSSVTSFSVFWLGYLYNNTTPGSIEITPESNVQITSASTSYGLAYNTSAGGSNSLVIGGGASFTYDGKVFTTTGAPFKDIRVETGTAAQPTQVTVHGATDRAFSISALIRCLGTMTLGDYCSVKVSGHPGGYNGIYVGGALTVGDHSELDLTLGTTNGTGSLEGNGIDVVGNVSVGSNSKLSVIANGNVTNTAAEMLSFGGSFKTGEKAEVTIAPKAGISTWAVGGTATGGTFHLGKGTSFLIEAPGTGTSNRSGLYLATYSGLSMDEGASLKVYSRGFNSVDGTVGNLVYLPNGEIKTGVNCQIEVAQVGSNQQIHSGIRAKGINEGANSIINVDLNATTTQNGIWSEGGHVTVGEGAKLSVHTAASVNTRYYLMRLVGSSSLTVNRNGILHLIGEDSYSSTSGAACLYVNTTASGDGVNFHSPKSVIFYDKQKKAMTNGAGATRPFNINKVQQINRWDGQTTITYPLGFSAGRFNPLPNYNWRSAAAPNAGVEGNVTTTGSIGSGTAAATQSFSTLSAPGVVNVPALAKNTGTDAPTTGTFTMANGTGASYAISFGYLPLTASYNSAASPAGISGKTDPGSSVVLEKWNGTSYDQVGNAVTADENGAYLVDGVNASQIESDVQYRLVSSNAKTYLTTAYGTEFYSVTFDPNGGRNSASLQNPYYVMKGSTIPTPPKPTYGVKSFAGWYTDEELTQPFAFGETPVNSNLTLYAKWVETSLVFHEKVVNSSGQTAGDTDYLLAGLDPEENQAFKLVLTDQQTQEVYHVIAYRDQPTILEGLPLGHTFTVRAIAPQHYISDSIELISEAGTGIFTGGTASQCTVHLEANTRVEVQFINKISPAGFGSAENISNLFHILSAD